MKTDRIGFGTWTEADLPLAERLWSTPEVARFIARGGVFSQEDIARRLQTEINNQSQHGLSYWPIFLLETGDFLGCCGLRPFDVEPGAVELGVHLVPEAWGKGIATEAGHAVIAHAQDTLRTGSLFAGHHPHNDASRHLLGKLGFAYLFDSYYEPTGLMHPAYRYGDTNQP